jgi:hypothetical protein
MNQPLLAAKLAVLHAESGFLKYPGRFNPLMQGWVEEIFA